MYTSFTYLIIFGCHYFAVKMLINGSGLLMYGLVDGVIVAVARHERIRLRIDRSD